MESLHLAPSAVTKERLVNYMAESCKTERPSDLNNVLGSQLIHYHSTLVASSELGNLLTDSDPAFMNILNELYDCADVFTKETKTSGNDLITNAHMTMIAGTQPNYLAKIIPEEAFGMGFASRLLFIYAAEPVKIKLNLLGAEAKIRGSDELKQSLIRDMQAMLGLYGACTWTKEAAEAMEAWFEEGLEPAPQHNRLAHYNTRRLIHALKLCIIGAVDRGDKLEITLRDFQWAKATLLEAEAVMPEAFKEMAASGDSSVMEDVYAFVLALHGQHKRPIPEHMLVNLLRKRLPVNKVVPVLETMITSNMLKAAGNRGSRQFLPVAKLAHGV